MTETNSKDTSGLPIFSQTVIFSRSFFHTG